MYLYRHSEESRRSTAVVLNIVDGKSWTARFIPNNNLRQHCHLLARTFRGPHPNTDAIRSPCLRLLRAIMERCGLMVDTHPSQFQAVPVIVRIAAYSHRWIRDPETWPGTSSANPRDIVKSLVEHLFVNWSMPACFDSAWQIKGDLTYLERDWYCHLASGGSLRKVQGMPPSITSRALHLAMGAPADLTIREALRWGQIKSLGGTDQFLSEVLSSRMVKDLSNDAIWSRLFEKVVAANHFNPRNFGIIADALLVLIDLEKSHRASSLVNLPLNELLRHCRKYWQDILRLTLIDHPDWHRTDLRCACVREELRRGNSEQWARLPFSKPFESTCIDGENHVIVRIVELTSQSQLIAESRSMRHCVDTYGRSCLSGRTSIFSARTRESVDGRSLPTSHLTIEVHRQTRRIVQVRGRRNLLIDPKQTPLLRKWAEALKLAM